jgi:hypothetical protein
MRNNSNLLLIVDRNLLEYLLVKTTTSGFAELPISLFRIYIPRGEVMSVIEAESAPFNQE